MPLFTFGATVTLVGLFVLAKSISESTATWALVLYVVGLSWWMMSLNTQVRNNLSVLRNEVPN